MVDPRGLILVPRMVVEPTFPGIEKLTNEQRASFKLEARDFRVRFSGHDTPLVAEALTSDPDLGIAWPMENPTISAKDGAALRLGALREKGVLPVFDGGA